MTEPHDDGGALQTTVMAPKSFLTLELTAGQVMRVEDMDGIQCADIAFLDREDYRRRKGEAGGAIAQSLIEQYSPGMTVGRNRHVYLGKGYPLYTNRCRKIMTIVGDTVGHHDVISAWCNPELSISRWGEVARGRRTCKENIRDALAGYGIAVDLPCTFNIFMNFAIGADGAVTWNETVSKPGDYIDLKAEIDVIVAISNCPMELSVVNGFEPTRLRVAVFEAARYLEIAPEARMEAIEVEPPAAVVK